MSSAIVILGSPNDQKGNLSPIAISRADAALVEFKKNKASKILCTGGFGQHFNLTDTPHGKYLQDYLIVKGVPVSSFIEVALSSYTLEDATLSKPILERHAITRCILVTSDFHMERAKLVFNHVLPDMDFEYSKAVSSMGEEEREKLMSHEQAAIKRELANFAVKV